jgi:hypothetical protein
VFSLGFEEALIIGFEVGLAIGFGVGVTNYLLS